MVTHRVLEENKDDVISGPFITIYFHPRTALNQI